jgi:hypothetical protein
MREKYISLYVTYTAIFSDFLSTFSYDVNTPAK